MSLRKLSHFYCRCYLLNGTLKQPSPPKCNYKSVMPTAEAAAAPPGRHHCCWFSSQCSFGCYLHQNIISDFTRANTRMWRVCTVSTPRSLGHWQVRMKKTLCCPLRRLFIEITHTQNRPLAVCESDSPPLTSAVNGP